MASSARIDELRKKFDENPRRYFAPLANEFRKAGDLEQAVFICQEYLPQQPGHMSGHIVYGQALFELGRDEEAKAVFETALSLDPENLIALRHLGDIARQAGDLDVARFWYQRVLESDPRNEEIAQVVMSMDAGSSQPAPAAVEPPPLPETSTIAERELAPAVEEPAEPAISETVEPIAAAAAPSDTQSYEPFEGFDRNIDFDQPSAEAAGGPELPEQAEAGAEAPSPLERAAEPPQPVAAQADERSDDHELLDLDDFSIGGEPVEAAAQSEPALQAATDQVSETPTVEFGETTVPSDAPAITNKAIESESAHAALDEVGPLADEPLFDINAADATFEPEPPQASTPSAPDLMPDAESAPVIELASDIHLGLPPDESAAPTEFRPEPEPQPATAESVAVDTHEPAPAAEAPPSAATDEVFATETMANLYVQQGHLAEALEIYEKLLARDPSSATLQRRIHDVTERIYGKPHDTVWEAEGRPANLVSSAAAPAPTIREFLRGLIARGVANVAPSSAGSEAEPADVPSEAAPGATVTGSIDALFANASPSEDDRSAANALAQAFGEWPEPTPIQGVPAHEASSELSLDHVFKANAPVPRRDEADAFSFDQFFSGDLAEGESGTERAPGSGSAGGDDIAQFNTWLNGLKKT